MAFNNYDEIEGNTEPKIQTSLVKDRYGFWGTVTEEEATKHGLNFYGSTDRYIRGILYDGTNAKEALDYICSPKDYSLCVIDGFTKLISRRIDGIFRPINHPIYLYCREGKVIETNHRFTSPIAEEVSFYQSSTGKLFLGMKYNGYNAQEIIAFSGNKLSPTGYRDELTSIEGVLSKGHILCKNFEGKLFSYKSNLKDTIKIEANPKDIYNGTMSGNSVRVADYRNNMDLGTIASLIGFENIKLVDEMSAGIVFPNRHVRKLDASEPRSIRADANGAGVFDIGNAYLGYYGKNPNYGVVVTGTLKTYKIAAIEYTGNNAQEVIDFLKKQGTIKSSWKSPTAVGYYYYLDPTGAINSRTLEELYQRFDVQES